MTTETRGTQGTQGTKVRRPMKVNVRVNECHKAIGAAIVIVPLLVMFVFMVWWIGPMPHATVRPGEP